MGEHRHGELAEGFKYDAPHESFQLSSSSSSLPTHAYTELKTE